METGTCILHARPKLSKALGRKILSLAMSFNALIVMSSACRNLFNFYECKSWKPYSPYLLDGNLLWTVVVSSMMNLISSVRFGRVRIKRLLFHHYVYGVIVLLLSIFLLGQFYSISLLQLFARVDFTGDYFIFVCFFFAMGGIALILDDTQDIKPLNGLLSRLQINSRISRRPVDLAKYLLHTFPLYIALCISLWLLDNPWRLDPSWIVYITSLLLTALQGFMATRKFSVQT